MTTKNDTPTFVVKPLLRPDLDDDPMGVYIVEPAASELTKRYFAAEPETPELAAVHAENAALAQLFTAAPKLLAALVDLVYQLKAIGIPDWHGAEGLSLEESETAIIEATGGTPSQPQPIIIEVRGGVVVDVQNVPPGCQYEIKDYDDREADDAAAGRAA